MYYRILFFAIIVLIENIAWAQGGKTGKSREYDLYQSVDSLCNTLISNRSLRDSDISLFDSLLEKSDSTLSFFVIKKITLTVLELKNTDSYFLILKHWDKFYHKNFMNASELGRGRIYTIPQIFGKWSQSREKREFADYLYNSDYLDQKRSIEENNMAKSIFFMVRSDDDQLRYKQTEPDNEMGYNNLEYIFNYSMDNEK